MGGYYAPPYVPSAKKNNRVSNPCCIKGFCKKKPPPFHRRFTANFGKSTRNCAKSSIVFLKLVYENGGILDMAEVKKRLTVLLQSFK